MRSCLKITAHLGNGFISADPWSPAIDGIIGYQYMRKKLGEEQFAMNQHRTDQMEPVDDLPLEKESFDGQWWYCCSSPIYEVACDRQVHLHRRFDAQRAEKYWTAPKSGKSGKVLVAAGPYKNTRMPYTHRITRAVDWHVLGDKAAISPLLLSVTHIGSRTGSGFGRVIRWEITADGDEEKAKSFRPLPVGYRPSRANDFVMIHGLRPPVRHPLNRVQCVMP